MHDQDRGAVLHRVASGYPKPYIPARETIARILAPYTASGTGNSKLVANAILAQVGNLKPHQLAPAHIKNICAEWEGLASSTRRTYASRLRAHLVTLGAPWQCAGAIPHLAQSKPRNITAADAEFEAVLRKAPGWLKLTLLLTRYCALRASTALTLTAADIDQESWRIRRRTKAQMSISIPCGPRVREMLRFALHMAEPGQYLVNALGGKGDSRRKLYENSTTPSTS